MIVVLIDNCDAKVRPRKAAGNVETAETRSDNDDMWPGAIHRSGLRSMQSGIDSDFAGCG
jgi:hypothetical protein